MTRATSSDVEPSAEVTPRALGFAMPAEWEPHEATYIAWPHDTKDWPGKFAPIPWIFAEIVRLIARGEKVRVLLTPGKHSAERVREMLDKAGADLKKVELISQKTDRVWIRDSGPIFVRKPGAEGGPAELAILDWKFNAWAKYPNFDADDRLSGAIARRLNMQFCRPMGINDAGEFQRFVLEGGSIDVNGAPGGGCVLTTEECLLSNIQQRNPCFSREAIEMTLRDYLGVQKVLWLNRGVAGDDTHGHVDDTARFVNATTIVTSVQPNRRDDNHAPMLENLRRLKKMRDTRGKQFTIVELPLPSIVLFDGLQLPASYANFYICNAGVLVPMFNDAADSRALKVLEHCFKDRPVIPVYCRDLVWGLGALHCMTQQQPAVAPHGVELDVQPISPLREVR